MKMIKRVAALVLSMVLLLTVVACHQPNETVLKVGEVEIPAGLYLAFQMDSFSTFTTNVQSTLTSSQTMNTVEEALSYSYEEKNSVDWIRNETVEAAKEYAAINMMFKEYGLEITEEDETNLADWVDYYWSEDYQNSKAYYEPNGVSKETFTELMRNSTRETKVFSYYYGKDGVEPVSDDAILEGFKEHYVLVNVLPIAKTTTDSSGNSTALSEDELAAAKAKLEGYAERMNKGRASFVNVVEEYNRETDPEYTMPAAQEGSSEKYPYATALTAADSEANFKMFDELRDKEGFAYNKAYVVEDDGYYYLGQMLDITTDTFYTQGETYRENVLYALKGEDFEKKVAEKAAALTVETNNGLVRYYSPKNIVNG